MTVSLLVIDDDEKLTGMLKEYLTRSDFNVSLAHTGAEGLAMHAEQRFEAVVLDLMLPDSNGLDVCQALQKESSVPVIMLTAKGDPMDRIVGLEVGADDYLPKPFESRELLARLRAVLRRGGEKDVVERERFGRLDIDRGAMEVRLDGQRCELTSYQFQVLDLFAKNAGAVMSRDAVMMRLKGNGIEVFDRSIDVHISRIRSAIEEDPKHPKRLITVRGIGYVFAKSQD
ncbi:response regulator transcription factor [Pontixanthobacter sp. CEM42]|uniref:response regulator n=1 Tax=Pontixanthobacter sp. CEM42 TaxID=2792077 RepID=UPI001ADF8571|nr:response regulator transcription factor [Pontixanthobacter sp. CEM42]